MTDPMFPDPDMPHEPAAIRARVPDHVAGGAFSTGVIVMTAPTEFVLDFVQNLGRPHQIVARIVMPHNVLPQLIDALQRNIDLYRGRWGELPSVDLGEGSSRASTSAASPTAPLMDSNLAGLGISEPTSVEGTQPSNSQPANPQPQPAPGSAHSAGPTHHSPGGQAAGGTLPAPGEAAATNQSAGHSNPSGGEAPPQNPQEQAGSPSGGQRRSGARRAVAQDIYDDLKIRDELLSGVYANAVMIGHGPYEFNFDFITNFYPHSAVSSRVFLAAGQVPRLFDSLQGTWEQMRQRRRPPGNPPAPPTDDKPNED